VECSVTGQRNGNGGGAADGNRMTLIEQKVLEDFRSTMSDADLGEEVIEKMTEALSASLIPSAEAIATIIRDNSGDPLA
jgi:hypothetical protein